MKIDEKTFKAMPADLQVLFRKCPNPGSDEVVALFPGNAQPKPERRGKRGGNGFGYFDDKKSADGNGVWPADPGGSAARFFYCAKASKADRGERNNHPTVKPSALMRYLVRLVTPPHGTVLDPFAGSGSTGVAAIQEGFRFIGIEKEEEYVNIARTRCEKAIDGIESSKNKQVSLFDSETA